MTRTRTVAVILALLLACLPTVSPAQSRIERAPGVNGAGLAKGTLTIPSGSMIQINMSTPTITSATKDDGSGSLAAGAYKITVVGVDPAGGVTLYPTALTATCAGGASHIDVVYVAPVGAVSTRVYVTLPGGATPDRYFVSTSATAYAFTTVAGATVAALPTAANAYRMSIGGSTNWYGAVSLFPAGTVTAPSVAYAGDTNNGFYWEGGDSTSISAGGVRQGWFENGAWYVQAALLFSADGARVIGNPTTYRPGAINIGGRTVTVNTQPALNIAETWNEGSTTFGLIKAVITDTASASGSLVVDIKGGVAGATNLFKVDKGGNSYTGTLETTGNIVAGTSSYVGVSGKARFGSSGSGIATFINDATATGFTTLNLGPTTGNTANGTLSITKTSTVCTIDTSTGCTGVGTNVVTMTSGSLPDASLILGATCKNTVAITGSAGFVTYSAGDGSDVDRWGAGIAKALNTTLDIDNYTTASPAYQLAAGSLVFTANGAETFTAGVISCTVYSINFTPIGS